MNPQMIIRKKNLIYNNTLCSKQITYAVIACIFLSFINAKQAYSQKLSTTKQTNGLDVCPNPAKPCFSASHQFATFDLTFRLPKNVKPGKNYRSVPFYAIILITYKNEDCDADGYTISIERKRLELQKEYPVRKVFGSHNCPDMDAITYDFPGKTDKNGTLLYWAFTAVYAGKLTEEAKKLLKEVQAKHPKAQLKRMTASFEIMNQ